ncbi:MAG: DJ-1/PfpI family protein, partial [Opitutae bacterium]
IQEFADKERPIGAICAAPLLLKDAGVLTNKSFTGHGSIMEELPQIDTEQAVVIDDKIITSRGAGTALEFGLSLIELLCGPEKAREIRHSIHA